eukprot:TRINITY_DN10969_c0_g1_i7.p1 TRINITY_DN10969_c0_g1~~TRINITY_DN10969_c0_g1_i7.p1  ORF type:complete len:833 (-),score=83.51 TRINITY_DN10969_c0_g1_i7:212-2359(-)
MIRQAKTDNDIITILQLNKNQLTSINLNVAIVRIFQIGLSREYHGNVIKSILDLFMQNQQIYFEDKYLVADLVHAIGRTKLRTKNAENLIIQLKNSFENIDQEKNKQFQGDCNDNFSQDQLNLQKQKSQEWSFVQLSKIVQGLSAMTIQDKNFARKLAQKMCEALENLLSKINKNNFDGNINIEQSVCAGIYSLSQMNIQHNKLINISGEYILKACKNNSHQMHPQNVASFIQALSKLKIVDSIILNILCQQQVIQNIEKYAQNSLGKILQALSHLRYRDDELMKIVRDRIVNQEFQLQPKHISDMISCYSRFQCIDTDLSAKFAECVMHAYEFMSLTELAETADMFVRMEYYEEKLYSVLSSRFVDLVQKMEQFSDQNLDFQIGATMLFSYAKIRHHDDELFGCICDHFKNYWDTILEQNQDGRCQAASSYSPESQINSNFTRNLDSMKDSDRKDIDSGDKLNGAPTRQLPQQYQYVFATNCLRLLWAIAQHQYVDQDLISKLANILQYNLPRQKAWQAIWSMTILGQFDDLNWWTDVGNLRLHDVHLREEEAYQIIKVKNVCMSMRRLDVWHALQVGAHEEQRALRKLKRQYQQIRKTVSQVQMEVFDAFSDCGINCKLETEMLKGSISTDFSFGHGGRRYAVEVDGPQHFSRNKPFRKTANTILRNLILRGQGCRVIEVPVYEWAELEDGEQKQQYVRTLLAKYVYSDGKVG